MRTLQKVLAIVALVVLVAQSVRHTYIRWLEPRTSVLDRYERPLKSEITAAKSLEELVARYEPLRKQAEEARKQRQTQKGSPGVLDENELGALSPEYEVRLAIQDWETKAKELNGVLYYCVVGLVLLAVGIATFRWGNIWMGLALEISAFSEFIYWTSPTFFGSAGSEFDRLLSYKLFFSVAALALLFLVVWLQRVFAKDDALEPAKHAA